MTVRRSSVALRKFRSALWRLGNACNRTALALRNLGWRDGLRFLRARLVDAIAPKAARHYELRTSAVPYPLMARSGTSDLEVFHQVFAEREYDALSAIEPPELVLDCGANVGYSAAYFLARFPTARCVAVEPDPGNAEMLRRNLAPFGERARVVQAAVWSNECGLVLSRGDYRGGGEWAVQVRECRPGEPAEIEATSVQELLAGAGFERVGLLKMDIEGAELAVFGAGAGSWLDRVDNIVIELHDEECERAFDAALAGRGGVTTRRPDLTIWHRRGAVGAEASREPAT